MEHDRQEWQRPWVEGVVPPVVSTDPFAGASAVAGSPAGPGSPEGSVRPPDTVATVIAPARPPRRGVLAGLAGGVVGAVLGTVGTLAVLTDAGIVDLASPTSANGAVEGAPAPSTSAIITLEGAESVIPTVAAAVTPSVVRIDVALAATNRSGAVGSGVIYRSDGYIITNNHVVEGARAITVRLADGELLDAELVGTDPLNDLAVLRVPRTGLPAVSLRDASEPLVVGETVVAIGSPFGLDASVTAGIVSALNRELRLDESDGVANTIPSVIQTDAAINPGNSGGALVDTRGRLVGINTAIYSSSGSNEGIGFAVSVGQAVVSTDQLITQGFVRHPLLGITGIDVSRDVADRLGLPATRGAVVDSVQPRSGAEAAGIVAGDVIVGVDGRTLATMSELVAEVRRRMPGDRLALTVFRAGQTLEVSVTLGERPRD
jgi:S1-C subfamily serine protease